MQRDVMLFGPDGERVLNIREQRAQYEYELEMEFWKSNPDYIPLHVGIVGEPIGKNMIMELE